MFAAARTFTTAVAPRSAPTHRRRAVRARAEKPSWAPGFDTPEYLDGSMPWCVKDTLENVDAMTPRAKPRESARERATRERGDEVIGRRWTRARRASEARAGRGGGETRAKTRSYRDDAAKTRRREDARTRGRGRRGRTRREGGCGEERARGETDGEAVRRRAIATTGSTRSSSAKSRRTSRATARRSSCTRDGPCSASPV